MITSSTDQFLTGTHYSPKTSSRNSPGKPKNESSHSSMELNSRFESYTTNALINYYADKINDYEKEVAKQKQLLLKRRQLLLDTRKIKFRLVDLKIQQDAIIEETSKIEDEISQYE